MDQATARSIVAKRLGNRTDLNTDIDNEFTLAATDLSFDPMCWNPFQLTEVTRASLTSGEERLALPSDFVAESDRDHLWFYDTTASEPWVKLLKWDLDTLRNSYAGVAAGKPQKYALHGSYFRIFPEPDDSYQIRMVYRAELTVANWLTYFPSVLINEAGARLAAFVGNSTAGKLFQEERRLAIARLQSFVAAREVQNEDSLHMGGSE